MSETVTKLIYFDFNSGGLGIPFSVTRTIDVHFRPRQISVIALNYASTAPDNVGNGYLYSDLVTSGHSSDGYLAPISFPGLAVDEAGHQTIQAAIERTYTEQTTPVISGSYVFQMRDISGTILAPGGPANLTGHILLKFTR